MNKKEQIRELGKQGLKPYKIAVLVGVSRQYVYQCLGQKETNKSIIKQELTVANYIKAVKTGYGTKDDLAKQFHVRKETLLNFEKESGVIQLLVKYYYMQGKSISEIGKILHLRIKSIQNTYHLPTIDKVRQDLNTILNTYAEMAEFGDEETVKYNELKKLIDKLRQISILQK